MRDLIKTKTFWTGISMIAYGIITIKSNPETGIQSIMQGLGFIFLRQAINGTKPNNKPASDQKQDENLPF
jgi:hypothetical protein